MQIDEFNETIQELKSQGYSTTFDLQRGDVSVFADSESGGDYSRADAFLGDGHSTTFDLQQRGDVSDSSEADASFTIRAYREEDGVDHGYSVTIPYMDVTMNAGVIELQGIHAESDDFYDQLARFMRDNQGKPTLQDFVTWYSLDVGGAIEHESESEAESLEEEFRPRAASYFRATLRF